MSECNDFEILGFKVRFKSDGADGSFPEGVSAKSVVDLVKKESMLIAQSMSGLSNGNVAILAALKIAAEKLALENDYKANIDKLQNTSAEALNLIEHITLIAPN